VFALRRFVGGTWNVRQQPGELGAGKIRIEQQAGLGGEERLVTGGAKLFAQRRGAPVLPDDGAMHRAPGGALPQQRRLALVGDADGNDIARAGIGVAQHGAAGGKRRRPQIFRLVLDLAVGRKMLREFLLGNRRDRGVGAKQHGARRGRALVDRQYVRCHAPLPSRRKDATDVVARMLFLDLQLTGRHAFTIVRR
jgi:hypothetical protein